MLINIMAIIVAKTTVIIDCGQNVSSQQMLSLEFSLVVFPGEEEKQQ